MDFGDFMFCRVLDETGEKNQNTRQAQADPHAVDNAHMRECISRSNRVF